MKKVTLSDQTLNAIIRDTREKILASLPAAETVFTGERLMKLAQHRQVNYFLLFQISQDWNGHIPSLVHPYFDFENAEVKQAMARFVNTVSRNIRVQRKDLDLLLDRAIFNTIRLILHPGEVLAKFFFGTGEAIPLELYRKHAPYFSDFDFAVQSILAYHEKNGFKEIRRDVFAEKFLKVLEIFEQKEGKTLQVFQRHYFQSLTGLELDNVIAKDQYEQKPEAQKVNPVAPEQKPVIPPATKVVPPPPVVVSPPVVPPVPVPPPVAVNPPPPVPEQKLADKFSKDTTSLSELYSQKAEEKKASINDLFNNPLDQKNQVVPEEKPVILLRTEEVKTPPAEPPSAVIEEPLPPVVETPAAEPPPLLLPVSPEISEVTQLTEAALTIAEEQTPAPLPLPVVETPAEIPPAPLSVPELVEGPPPVAEAPVLPPPVIETPIDLFAPREEKKENPSLHESMQDDQRTSLADKFRTQQPRTVSEKAEAKSIRIDQIPVHKQFQFVQKVFGGSSVRFKVMLDKINETKSASELEELLNKYVFSEEGVNRDDKVTQEFLILVRNRFGS